MGPLKPHSAGRPGLVVHLSENLEWGRALYSQQALQPTLSQMHQEDGAAEYSTKTCGFNCNSLIRGRT